MNDEDGIVLKSLWATAILVVLSNVEAKYECGVTRDAMYAAVSWARPEITPDIFAKCLAALRNAGLATMEDNIITLTPQGRKAAGDVHEQIAKEEVHS